MEPCLSNEDSPHSRQRRHSAANRAAELAGSPLKDLVTMDNLQTISWRVLTTRFAAATLQLYDRLSAQARRLKPLATRLDRQSATDRGCRARLRPSPLPARQPCAT
jgi:hypothetical protein